MAHETSAVLQACAFTDRIPAEIRNTIYHLVFSSADDSPQGDNYGGDPPSEDEEVTIELLDARAPRKDLLLTCRQIYGEARGIYNIFYRCFWRTTKFSTVKYLALPRRVGRSTKLMMMREEDLDSIGLLKVILQSSGLTFDLLDKRGLWRVCALDSSSVYHNYRDFSTPRKPYFIAADDTVARAEFERICDSTKPKGMKQQLRQILGL